MCDFCSPKSDGVDNGVLWGLWKVDLTFAELVRRGGLIQ